MSLHNEGDTLVQYSNLMATAMACDCHGQFALLCGPKQFALVNLENPKEIVATITRNGRSKFCAVQWHPHSFRSDLFLSASNQFVELWSWDGATCAGSHRTTLKGHTRTVHDFDWSFTEPNHVATCSADKTICVWDMRESRRPAVNLGSFCSPSHVKWSRLREKILATTHNDALKIWDIRMPKPVIYITAHDQKVTGLDWSPFNDCHLLTCSEDGLVKVWDITASKQEVNKIQSTSTFDKVKYMPFANGLATSSNGSVCLWSLNKSQSHELRRQPLCTYGSLDGGGRGVIVDFCWRSIDPDYQLIMWSENNSLALCKIDDVVKQCCGNDLYSSSPDPPNNLTPDRELVELEKIEQPKNETLDLEDVAVQEMNDQLPNNVRQRKSGSHQAPVLVDSKPRKDSPSLRHEFALLNVKIPYVKITEMSVERQLLKMVVLRGSHKVYLTMSFPNSYPNKVSPEFVFSEDTTLEKIDQEKLIADMQSTALQYVQLTRCCIEPCMYKLISGLDAMIRESQLSADQTEVTYLPMNEIWPPFQTAKLRDERIPFPRISGARFCGPGFLVCFTRRMFVDARSKLSSSSTREQHMRKESESEVTPRAMSAISKMGQPTASGVRIVRDYIGPARSLPSDTSVLTISRYYEIHDQKPLLTKLGQMDEAESPPRIERRRNPVGPVIVYDLSCLLPVQKSLGENYVFSKSDPAAMCLANARVAAVHGRRDLIQTWRMAATMIAQSSKSSNFGDLETPWSLHPFGHNLIKYWFDYYSSIRDIQMLAMLSCALGSPNALSKKSSSATPMTPTTTPKPSTSSNSSTVNSFLESESTGQNFAVRKLRRSNSWSEVKFEGVDQTPDSDSSESSLENADKEMMGDCVPLLDPASNVQYDMYKLAYANTLYQWRLMTKRAELLKHLTIKPDDQQFKFCVKSTASDANGFSSDAASSPNICVICQLKVKGLFSLCVICGHGGHMLHIMDWFDSHTYCATGCGCECIYDQQDNANTSVD